MKRIRLYVALAGLILSSPGALVSFAQVGGQSKSAKTGAVWIDAADASNAIPSHEDWSTLAVDRAALQPISSAVIGTSALPEFTREVIRVQWRAGDPIDLFVIKPNGIQKPSAILYLYGYPNDTNRFWDDGWCLRATRGGVAAVGFVSALTGQRYANRPMKEWFVSQLPEALGSTTHDVQMILDYLARRDDLATQQFGMYGQGSGGTVALLAAAVDPRIAFVDVLDPWGDWPEWLGHSPEVPDDERASYLTPNFLKSVENLDPVKYLATLKLKGLRVQQVLDEPVTPTKAKAALREAGLHSGEITQYKNEREHLEVWRVSGLSGWMRGKMHPPAVCDSSLTAASNSGTPAAAGPSDSQPCPSYHSSRD